MEMRSGIALLVLIYLIDANKILIGGCVGYYEATTRAIER